MCKTLLVFKSMIPYEPYLAECPGLSACPSPPMEREVPWALQCVNNFDRCSLHTETMLGSRYRFWCKKMFDHWCMLLACDSSSSVLFQGLHHCTKYWQITRCCQLGCPWCEAGLSMISCAHNEDRIAWWLWMFPFGKQLYHGIHYGMMCSVWKVVEGMTWTQCTWCHPKLMVIQW